jgi:hypothetical protein
MERFQVFADPRTRFCSVTGKIVAEGSVDVFQIGGDFAEGFTIKTAEFDTWQDARDYLRAETSPASVRQWLATVA